jgi:hypothetical protein
MTKETTEAGSRQIRWLPISIGILLALTLAVIVSQRATLSSPDQPIDFSHQRHDQAEIQCLFCHPSAMRSDIAGIPSVQMCAGCHQVIASERPEIQILLGYWDQGQPIPWRRVVDLDDHVFFSHFPHTRAGVSCETCHGDVARMDAAREVLHMDMGWCLDCHLEQPEAEVARLVDCLVCHE